MRERTSFAGRREGLDFWVSWAALRAFFARERDGVGLRDRDGEEEEEESLSFAEVVSVADGCKGMMSSLASKDEGGLMLAKEESAFLESWEGYVGAMAFHDGNCDKG